MDQFIKLLASSPLLFVGLAGIYSLLVGSFLNVVIYRLPVMMQRDWDREVGDYLQQQAPVENNEHTHPHVATSPTDNKAPQEPFNLVFPRSRCGSCGALVKAWQNIPVLSYALLRGRCGHCGTSISLRYPAIELMTALIAMLVAWQFQTDILAAVAAIFLSYALITLFWIDFDTYLLPDSITLPLLWGGLIANAFGLITDLQSAVFGAAAGYLILWSVFWVFKLVTGKDGMGYGDFKLLAALGAWLGWQYLPVIIVLSSLVGAVLGISMILLAGRDQAKPIPFGPYLATAGLLALLWGDKINDFYLSIL